MRPFEVEIFTQDFEYVSHTLAPDIDYSMDYLDPENNKITLLSGTAAEKNDYIRIHRNSETYFGIITAVDTTDSGIQITYKDFMALLDVDLCIDVNAIGTGTAEDYLKARIDELFISNPDAQQIIADLSIVTGSSTADWTLPIEADDDEESNHYTVVNLFDDIIMELFSSYGIVISVDVDYQNKTILLTIATNSAAKRTIEADLPNVISKSVTLRKASKVINKCYIYNKKDYTMSTIYYLHSDGSYDETDTDRLWPVSFKVTTVSTKNTADYETAQEKSYTNAITRITRIQAKKEKKDPTLDDKDKQTVIDNVAILNAVPGIALTIGEDGYVETWDEETIQSTVDAYILSYDFELYCRSLAKEAFDEKTLAKATSVMGKTKYTNNIKIEVANDDTLVPAASYNVGDLVNIISGGAVIPSIFTAKEVGDTTVLIFGMVRVELTKILKGRN